MRWHPGVDNANVDNTLRLASNSWQSGQDTLYIWLAWAYVALRVVHTLIQCTGNIVNLRFTVFSLSTLVLMAMAVRAVLAIV